MRNPARYALVASILAVVAGCGEWLTGARPCESDEDCAALGESLFCDPARARCIALTDTDSSDDRSRDVATDTTPGVDTSDDAGATDADAEEATDTPDDAEVATDPLEETRDVMDGGEESGDAEVVEDGEDTVDAVDTTDADAEDADADAPDVNDADAEDVDAEDVDAEDVDAEDVDAEYVDADDADADAPDVDDTEVDICDAECVLMEQARTLRDVLMIGRSTPPASAWVRLLVTVDTSDRSSSAADELAEIRRRAEQFDAANAKLTFVLDNRVVATCFEGDDSCGSLETVLALGHGAVLAHDRELTPTAALTAAENLRRISPFTRVALTGDCGDPAWYARARDASASMWYAPRQDCMRAADATDPGGLAEQAALPASRCESTPLGSCPAPAHALTLTPRQAWTAGPSVPTEFGGEIAPPGLWSLPWSRQGLQLAPSLGRFACLEENELAWTTTDGCELDEADLDVWLTQFDATASNLARRQVLAVDLRSEELDTVEGRTLLLLVEEFASTAGDDITSDTPESLSEKLELESLRPPLGIGGVWWVRESLEGPATYLFLSQSAERLDSRWYAFTGSAIVARPNPSDDCEQTARFEGRTDVPPDSADGPVFPANGAWEVGDGFTLDGLGRFTLLEGEAAPTLDAELFWPVGCRDRILLSGQDAEQSAIRVDRAP